MYMIRKGQFAIDGAAAMSFAYQFYALARHVRPMSAGVMPNSLTFGNNNAALIDSIKIT
jgi:hypothetical protein